MDSRLVNSTSLDLNINPFKLFNESPKREFREDLFSGFDQKVAAKEETGVLVGELNRITSENKKLTEMLKVLCENYNALQNQLNELKNVSEMELSMTAKKRKADSEDYSNIIRSSPVGFTESSSGDELESSKRPNESFRSKISRFYYPTDASDSSLVVKDGYHWRKYGQKVTRDNPSPRAYFKCSFAPTCPVKKKVQRSVENPCILVATYEGEHNHKQPSHPTVSFGSVLASGANPLRASGPDATTLDFIKTGILKGDNETNVVRQIQTTSNVQQILVQRMASSLTRDPKFTAALAAALSGRFNPTRA